MLAGPEWPRSQLAVDWMLAGVMKMTRSHVSCDLQQASLDWLAWGLTRF